MQPQPLIALSDVESGSLWFQHVLNLSSGHGGHEYEMLMDGDTMVAQLHDWDADEHAHLGNPSEPSRGNGVLLWFDHRRSGEEERPAIGHAMARTMSEVRYAMAKAPGTAPTP